MNTREELNKQVIELSSVYNRLLLAWGTSVGKSKAAIDIINKDADESLTRISVLLLIAERAHRNNWKEEFEKWSLSDNCDVEIQCYASLKKCVDKSYDIIVADEAHHLGSESRLSFIEHIKAHRYVLLSATMPKNTLSDVESVWGKFKIHRVNLQTSINNNILPEPSVMLAKLTLNNTAVTCEVVEKWGREERRGVRTCYYKDRYQYRNRRLYPDLELHIRCTEQQKYDIITDQYEYWSSRYKSTRQIIAGNKMKQIGSERKRFLGEMKTRYARYIISKMPAKSRFICFCTSIDQAESLNADNAIHSNKRNSLQIVNEFNDMKRNSLYAVGMLQEGMNLKNLDWGMIIQLDGCERGWVQKVGRMMRSLKPYIFILYFDNTKDIAYLQKVLDGIDNKYIKHFKL